MPGDQPHSAAEISKLLIEKDLHGASSLLVEDYLQMSEQDFGTLIKDMSDQTAGTKSAAVYSVQEYANVKGIFINDSFLNDSRVFRELPRVVPQSAPLKNKDLENVARNFASGLRPGKDDGDIEQDMLLSKALMAYGNKLNPNERAQLLNRAQQINLEIDDKTLPQLQVIFSDHDGDGVPLEPTRALLSMPRWSESYMKFKEIERREIPIDQN